MKDTNPDRVFIFDTTLRDGEQSPGFHLDANPKLRIARQPEKLGDNVEYSPEDAGRADPDYLVETVETMIAAGANVINIPDTTGYCLPYEFGELVRRVITDARGSEGALFSVHCHNDLGLAVANTLAALAAGARRVECTINGIGERAGNTSLEEVVT